MGGSVNRRLAAAAASIIVLGAVLLAASCENPLTWYLQGWSTFDMVAVPAGTMTLGDVAGVGDGTEQPTYKVQLSSFVMSQCEITQGLFEQVMGYNPSWFSPTGDPGTYRPYDPDLPVERVSWLEAVKFCNALSEARGFLPCYTIDESVPASETVQCDFTRNGFRLPTESEWEYAARGGPGGADYLYAGSNTLSAVAWSSENSSAQTHIVGDKSANGLGLYDMSGNVWEYVWDGWSPGSDYSFYWSAPYNYDGTTPILNPHGPWVLNNDLVYLDDNFALRGGGFTSSGGWYERVSARTWFNNAGAQFPAANPIYWQYDTGFRVVRTP